MPSPQEYRSFRVGGVSRHGRCAELGPLWGNLLKIGVPLGAVLVAAWMIYSSLGRGPKNMTAPDKEDFTTTQFPAPSLQDASDTDQSGHNHNSASPVSPPEPVVPPPRSRRPFALPAAANARGRSPRWRASGDDEARRLAELERLRQEEERRKWERFRAPQVISDNANPGALASNSGDAARGAAAQDDDPNRRFLSSVANAASRLRRR